ncbi:hypothetical protein BKA69DRAFT_1068663 [Paraphysoderma sedebokerense]|nr:hypothetical protein BKA69DRAFT_1068663 [Paraphysoderma sedebokerense]
MFYSIELNTCTLKEFNWLYSLFYINKIKIIPANIADCLTSHKIKSLSSVSSEYLSWLSGFSDGKKDCRIAGKGR